LHMDHIWIPIHVRDMFSWRAFNLWRHHGLEGVSLSLSLTYYYYYLCMSGVHTSVPSSRECPAHSKMTMKSAIGWMLQQTTFKSLYFIRVYSRWKGKCGFLTLSIVLCLRYFT
jgi:hypothetical protein